MKYENIVVGKPDMDISELFAYDNSDWENIEKEKTYYTEERYLPKILVDVKLVGSNSTIRKNKPELVMNLDKRDFMRIKWGKKFLFLAIFPEECLK